MYLFGISMFARSPFARMLATLVVEYLIRKGFIQSTDASQAVEDAVNVIGFLAMVITLLIWQWRAHHPAKAQLDVSIPVTEEEKKESLKIRAKVDASVRKFLDKFLETPQQ